MVSNRMKEVEMRDRRTDWQTDRLIYRQRQTDIQTYKDRHTDRSILPVHTVIVEGHDAEHEDGSGDEDDVETGKANEDAVDRALHLRSKCKKVIYFL